uniref:Uncharacterized protein n=1 Tax=Arundo donax TaxID=35708 RepID=A0A0A9BJM0_ARUDO
MRKRAPWASHSCGGGA